jgi:hypothetical protein
MTPNNAKYCDFCHSSIVSGQMWVRQKIHNLTSDGPNTGYLYFHADPFGRESESCWEKHEIERELLDLP